MTDANDLLTRLVELDRQTHGAYYDMGQLLQSFKANRLWELLGYESFPAMVEEELSFSTQTAYRYASTYRHLQRLRYSKAESLALLGEFGFTRVSEYVIHAKDKVDRETVARRMQKYVRARVINFMLDPDDYERAVKALLAEGAEFTEGGNLKNSSSAFMRLVRRRGKTLKRAA